MIIGHDSLWRQYRNSKKFTAEEEFYLKILDNPVWPFEDLGNGIFHLRLRSARIFVGIVIILATGAAACYFFILSGIFSFPVCVCIIFLVYGVMCFFGKLTTQELIIGREVGYLLRFEATRKVIVEQDIYNIYVRLQKKSDSVQTDHCYLIIGGYLLDDIRISRMTNNEGVMRVLGKYLARNLGINYFDHHDETIKHSVIHFRNSYAETKVNGEPVDVLFDKKPSFHVESETNLEGVFKEEHKNLGEKSVVKPEPKKSTKTKGYSKKSRVRTYQKSKSKSVFPGHSKRRQKFGLPAAGRKSAMKSVIDQLTLRRRKKE